ncbi:hypothetical protein JW865_03745 [Candidatus Bathyarchaeota archaeon]|nr:hypothetical protein [Candidatus Bathyarchaeota archaeon]
MSSLRSKINDLLKNRTCADLILDELINMDVTEENYLDFFDAANLVDIYENDIHQRRMKVFLKMKTCYWLKYKEAIRTINRDITN